MSSVIESGFGSARRVESLSLWRDGRRLLARIRGPLDMDTAPGVVEKIQGLCPDHECVVLDLYRADFIDSSGVRALLVLQQAASTNGAELRLVVARGSRLERTLTLLHLQEYFHVYPDLLAAWTGTSGDEPAEGALLS